MKLRTHLILVGLLILMILPACSSGGGGGGSGGDGDDSQQNIIGPEGGSYSSPEGVTITIPPDALTEEVTININLYTETTQLPLAIVGDLAFAGAVRFGPHGLKFERPVTIQIPLTTQLPALSQLPLFYFRNSPPSWAQTPFVGTVDMTGMTLTAEISHFSTFTIFYSQTDSADLGMFDSFIENANETNFLSELDIVVSNFSSHFPIGGLMIYDLNWDTSSSDNSNISYPDWWPDVPPPIVQMPPGYHCYETIGMQMVSIHSASEDAFATSYGQTTGADIHFVYSANRDLQERQGSNEGQFVAEVYVTLLLRAVPPDLTLVAGENHIGLGESTGLTSKLTCNEEPMLNQELVFAMGDPVLGSVDTIAGYTDGQGIVNAIFTAAPSPGGEQLLAATYHCCVGTDHEEDVLATTVVDIGESLEVDPPRIHLLKDESATLSATLWNALGEDITSNPFLWSSDNASMCAVDPEEGHESLITAEGRLGEATITVEDPETLATGNAHVLVGATVELEPAEQCLVKDLENNITTQINATIRDPEGTIVDYYNLQWISSDINSAMVNNIGSVLISDEGPVEIEARIDYPGTGNYSGTAAINVPVFPGDYTAEDITQGYSGESYILLNNRTVLSRLFLESYAEQELRACGYEVDTLVYWVDDINSNNQIVGGVSTDEGSKRYIVDLNECVEELLDPPIGMDEFALGRLKINDNGQVLLHAWNNPVLCPNATSPDDLYYPSYAFIYEGGLYTQINASGWNYTTVYDLNNKGQAVGIGGDACNSNADIIPFVYDDGVFQTYPESNYFTSINDEGLITGMLYTLPPAPAGVVDYFILHYPTNQTWWRATDIPAMSELLNPPSSLGLVSLPDFSINNERDILVYEQVVGSYNFLLFHLCPLENQQIP